MLLLQIDPVQLAREIALNIPAPEPGMDTWIYGLLVISGYLFAAVMFYFNQKRETKTDETLSNVNSTMTEVKVYLQGRAPQDERVNNIYNEIVQLKAIVESLRTNK